ncbi:ligand-dependent corepressor isoform X2 [Rhinoderma darwinii]|uniref:ligand-dependent corepressor isoform X2 n=1 Tax=Rhinoderma darwinii TaxID=43563 RepID=UPI003F6666FC
MLGLVVLHSWIRPSLHYWRAGFETILEGLFGPALLNDLSLFKDCEPTGVCDWSFNENCLFCCLRREKVKEHLAGFHKPINEPGQENLKQEQAKIIRLERQAEEFINAVFYKKDSPRISDPNIPLVAREIMQRMIRQFAAEYTSKNSSTQDSSPPNSTKNQSLPKSPSGKSSPPPATTQNPVLSKLLMADQDSPLDLTVKKPQSEEPCEQADGVLDLSTKKSPCSGSPNSSTSPSTSNSIGNGTQDTERRAIDPNTSSLSLEKFMAKLCSHHQKQFILVLNNLSTEEPIMKSKSRSASVSEIENANMEDYDHSCSDRKANLSLVEINKSVPESCLNFQVNRSTATDVHEENYHNEISNCSDPLSKVSVPSDFKEENSINRFHATDQTITNPHEAFTTTEEKTGTISAKISEVSHTVFLEHGVFSHTNSALNMLNDSPGSELPANIPKIANKENTQYINPKHTILDKDCNDCKLKQETMTTVMVKKIGNLCEGPFQNLNDHSGSALQKVRLHENKRLKTVKCRNTRVFVANDCDKQCDVVYISEPITTECHFENAKSGVCPRNSARKSTRGSLFNADCCELSTVRTLVRNSKVEDKGNCTLHMEEALIIPNGLISETLPFTDVTSLIHVDGKRVETDTFNFVSQNDEMRDLVPDSSRSSESENRWDQSLNMVEESVDHVSDSLTAVLSFTLDEPEKAHTPSNGSTNELPLGEHVDEITKTQLNCSVLNIDTDSLSVSDHEKSVAKLAIGQDFVFHANNSCNQDDYSGTPSLDMEVMVSLKNNHLLSERTRTPEFDPPNATMEEGSATLQYCHESPTAHLSSFPNGAVDDDLPSISPSSLYDAKILPEDFSEAVIADPAVTSDQQIIQCCSETISDVVSKENSERQISKTSQVDLSSCSSVINFHKHAAQMVVKESVHMDLKILEHAKEGQSVAQNDSVEMELKDPVPNRIDALQASHCEQSSAPDYQNARRPDECFHIPLNICAKIVGNINVRLEANGSKEDLQNCETVSSFGCNKIDKFEEPLKTNRVHGESNTGAGNLDKIGNSLIHKNTSKPFTPSKRHKKVPAPTDRCLRSREAHNGLILGKNPSLQVLLTSFTNTNPAQRSVALKTENTACITTIIDSATDQTSDDENYICLSLNSHCTEGKPLLCESMLKSTCSSPFNLDKNLSIHLEIGSDKRVVYFANESNHNCPNMVDAECKCGAKSVRNVCQLQLQKCNKRLSINSSNSVSRTGSSTNHVKHTVKNCKSSESKNLSTENDKQVPTLGQSSRCCSKKRDLSLNNLDVIGSKKQVKRPKFIDWCSEEENQELISKFNDKYTTVHKNWVPLARETANGAKSKNKADKLKEIWKTKKRARRPKSVQDASRSPMQLLFMNSLKFPDICEWFMETTETKSIVIVKKLNTRLPEDHLLPMIPSLKYPSESLYPHIEQAQRLKKHLKKFASVCPSRNDFAQNSVNELISSSPLGQVPKDTVKGPNDCKKQEPCVIAKKAAPVHILQKYNSLRENFKYPSCTVNKSKKVCMVNKAKSKAGYNKNIKGMSTSELRLQKVSNFLTSESHIIIKKKSKKCSKNDSMVEDGAQPNKKRKIGANQNHLINGPQANKNAISTKTKVGKLSKKDLTSKSQVPKKQRGKAGVYKTGLRKGKAKTPMQKQSLNSRLVLRRQTRSAKRRPVPPNLSDSPKITSSSSHRKNEQRKKICTASAKNKINVASQVRHRKARSQLEPSTRKGRSLELK